MLSHIMLISQKKLWEINNSWKIFNFKYSNINNSFLDYNEERLPENIPRN